MMDFVDVILLYRRFELTESLEKDRNVWEFHTESCLKKWWILWM